MDTRHLGGNVVDDEKHRTQVRTNEYAITEYVLPSYAEKLVRWRYIDLFIIILAILACVALSLPVTSRNFYWMFIAAQFYIHMPSCLISICLSRQ